MIHEISPDHPGVLGAFLSEKEIEDVARTLYNRFDYTYGLRPSWPDNEKIRKLKTLEVRRVLDALSISGYKVVKMSKDEERLPRK